MLTIKITLLTTGSRGDVQPFLLLGKRLVERGHEVMLCASPNLLDGETKYGVSLKPIGPSTDRVLADTGEWVAKGQTRKAWKKGAKAGEELYLGMGRDAFEAIQVARPDLIIFKYAWIAGYNFAEKMGIPCMSVEFFPSTPTKEFPCFYSGEGKDRGRLLNALVWWYYEQIVCYHYIRPLINYRRVQMGLKPFPRSNPKKHWRKPGGVPLFYPYSPAILPKPSDWPEHFHVTGVWHQFVPEDWAPPAALVAFLEKGPKPVYIGFGSLPNNPENTLDIILKAVEISGKRAIIFSGPFGVGAEKNLPETVFCVHDVPHVWLFPRMAAVVHHGGAGTTMAGVAAGVPSVITPAVIDQHSWAKRIYELGVGPEPVLFYELTAEKLAAVIQTATEDETMRLRAEELGEIVRAEDGLQTTVELIETYMS